MSSSQRSNRNTLPVAPLAPKTLVRPLAPVQSLTLTRPQFPSFLDLQKRADRPAKLSTSEFVRPIKKVKPLCETYMSSSNKTVKRENAKLDEECVKPTTSVKLEAPKNDQKDGQQKNVTDAKRSALEELWCVSSSFRPLFASPNDSAAARLFLF